MRIQRNRIIFVIMSVAMPFILHGSAVCTDKSKPYFRAEPIFEKIPGYPSSHGSTITQAQNGDLVAAWYSGAAEKATDVAIFTSRIPAGGDKWSPPEVLQDTPGQSDGNPVLFTAPDGKLWLYYVAIDGTKWDDCPIYSKFSSDNGRTWSEPQIIRKKKGWMTRNKPIALSDGRILLPLYDEALFQPHFYISSDNGATWANWGMMSQSQALQPTVVERIDGTLFCLMRTAVKEGDLWESTSSDMGKTWKKPKFSGLPNPGSAADMVKLANGRVALAFNDSRTDRNPLTVALSEDEGRTWPWKRNLEADKTGSYAYPAIFQDRDGIIHVTYSYNRDYIKHAEFNEAWIREGN